MAAGIVVPCEECGQKNRVPLSRIGKRGKCGKCDHPLPAPDHPLEVEQASELRAIIKESKVPVLVDFWASWCGPCRTVGPEIAKIAKKRAGDWLVVKANTEVDPQVGSDHGVRSIPMMAVFSGGKEVGRTTGARPAPAIEQFVQQTLNGE
ncbi:MAG: thioredoxin family protein [Deltaproteobacteria bacterium]|nr:thioredoxin family protein [Deltaproteobacteria bacterium]